MILIDGKKEAALLREELKKRAPTDSIFDPPFSTLQVGGIFGGIEHNVIADKCHINWETSPVIKEDGIFLNQKIDEFAEKVLLSPSPKNGITPCLSHDGNSNIVPTLGLIYSSVIGLSILISLMPFIPQDR